MNEILSDFLKRAEDSSTILSLEDSLSEDELFEYEVLVKTFDAIDIMHVGRDLKKINKTYQLSRTSQVALMAYVKILELMIKRAKEAGAMDMLSQTVDKQVYNPKELSDSQYDGSMFG